MDKELRGIVGDHPIVDAELRKIQPNETLKVPGSRETLDELEQAVAGIVEFRLPDDYYETCGSKVNALQVSDVNEGGQGDRSSRCIRFGWWWGTGRRGATPWEVSYL